MEYVLVKLNANWADEFDVDSLWVTTKANYEIFEEKLRENFVSGQELYFGTNECVTFKKVEDILKNITVSKISEQFYKEFKKLIGSEFGLLDLSDLPDRFYNEDEE